MNKLSAKMTARLSKFRNRTNARGFSMLEAVVVVGVLLALAAIGFVAYSQVTNNAKIASTESAASSVFTAAVAADVDGDASTDFKQVEDSWNASQKGDKGVKVVVSDSPTTGITVVATHSDSTEGKKIEVTRSSK